MRELKLQSVVGPHKIIKRLLVIGNGDHHLLIENKYIAIDRNEQIVSHFRVAYFVSMLKRVSVLNLEMCPACDSF